MTKTYLNIGGDVRDTSTLSVPADRAFRSAWQFNGSAVEIDMDKAREVQREVIRRERTPRLEALDVAFMRALESGEAVAAITAEKDALRAVTEDPRIDAVVTPEELKALTLNTLI